MIETIQSFKFELLCHRFHKLSQIIHQIKTIELENLDLFYIINPV